MASVLDVEQRPAAQRRPRVRTLAWKLLFAELRARLGDDGWDALVSDVGGPPDVREAPLDELTDAAAFDRAVAASAEPDRAGLSPDVLGRLLAQRWAALYRTLIARLRHRPDLVVGIYAREVHPWLFDGAPVVRVSSTGPDGAALELGDVLSTAFVAGFVDGLLMACDVEAATVLSDDGRLQLTWQVPRAPTTRRLALLVKASRARSLGASLVALAAGSMLAASQGAFAWEPFAIAATAVVLLHVAANLVNDIVDHRRGVDTANLSPTPFSGGSRVLQEDAVELRHLAAAAAGLSVLGALMGLSLIAWGGTWVVTLGIAGGALGFAYSAAPFRLVYRGLGELAVFVAFGPLLTAGAYALQAGAPSLEAWLLGVPIGLSMATVVYANGLADVQWDARRAKRTLPVRLGAWAAAGLAVAAALVHASLVALVAVGALPSSTLVGLVSLPVLALAVRGHLRLADRAAELVVYQALMVVAHLTFALAIAGALALEVWP